MNKLPLRIQRPPILPLNITKRTRVLQRQLLSTTSRPHGGDSDSSTSSEYLDASTPGKSDDGDVPNGMGDAGRSDVGMSYARADGMHSDTRSHIISIDSPTPEPFPCPSIPHPNVGLDQLQKDLKAIIVYTLHVDEKQPLANAEAQASSYVAKFIANFESQPSTKLNAAGYLYSCKKERLIQILSDKHPSPPRIVRRVCHVIHETLLYSEYGKVCFSITPLALFCYSGNY